MGELTAVTATALRAELARQWGAEFANYIADVDWSLMAQAALNAQRGHHRQTVNREPVEDAADQLADLIATRRTGGAVYMDGKHNPLPTERLDAIRFVEDLIGQGWRPHGRELEQLLDGAVIEFDRICCATVDTDAISKRARHLLGLGE